MKRHVLTLSLVLGAFALGAITQAKEDEKLAKGKALAKVAGFDSVGSKLVDQAASTLQTRATNDPKLASLIKALRVEAKPSELSQRLIRVHARHLDEKSLDALLAFYATPAGKAVAAKQSLIMAESKLQADEWLQAAFNRALKSQGIPSAIESLEESRRRGNEAAAIGGLRAISNAQTLYREGDKDRNRKLDYSPDMKSLGDCNLIDKVLAGGKKQGYRYKLCRGKGELESFLWMVIASPIEPGVTGRRYFAANFTGVIWYRTDKAFVLDTKECVPKGGKVLGSK